MGKLRPKKVFIYDVMAILHSGAESSYRKKWNVMGVPTSGLGLLLTYIATDLKSMRGHTDYVMAACFDAPVGMGYRRAVYEGYKSRRSKTREVLNGVSQALDKDAVIESLVNEHREVLIEMLNALGLGLHMDTTPEELLKSFRQFGLELGESVDEGSNEGEELRIRVSTGQGVVAGQGEVSGPVIKPYEDGTGYYYINGKYIHRDNLDQLPYGVLERLAIGYSVRLQTSLAWQLLTFMGVDCFYHEHLEADDHIYSLVNMYSNVPVLIRADDRDLLDCFSYNKSLTIKSVAAKGKLEPINGSELFRKTFEGCYSDEIPNLNNTECAQYKQLIAECMLKRSFNPFDVKYGNSNFAEFTAQPLLDLDIPEGPANLLARNMYLVYPFMLEFPERYTDLDLERFVEVLSIMHMKKSLGWLGRDRQVSKDMQGYMDALITNVPDYFKIWLGENIYAPPGTEGVASYSEPDVNSMIDALNKV